MFEIARYLIKLKIGDIKIEEMIWRLYQLFDCETVTEKRVFLHKNEHQISEEN
jgi:hypothetical protein